MKYNTGDELGGLRARRGVAFYHQVYLLLSAALNDGLISAGSALPTETALMEKFQVSRNTVRRALARLEQEKRIVRRRGSGSFARRMPQLESANGAVAEVLYDFNGVSLRSSSRLVRIQPSVTPEFIRRRDPKFGEKSLLVQRCRSFKNEPFMFSSSYVPHDLGAKLTRRQLSRQVVLRALAGIGSEPCTAEQTTTALPADAITARHLGVEPAAALLCIHRLIRDGSGRSIEHQSHLYRPDRFHLRAQAAISRTPAGIRWSVDEALQLPAEL
jgi:GntR family transcriptional regulator